MRYLTVSEVKQFYDAWGLKQDNPSVYESEALKTIVDHGQWASAGKVFELGAGTGNLAQRLLDSHLPTDAHYTIWEVSETMLKLCANRLRQFGDRVVLHQSKGDLPTWHDAQYDRIIANFVLDIFSLQQIQQFFAFAHANLMTGGLLCISNLSNGTKVQSRMRSLWWRLGYQISPQKFGGCRPIDLVGVYDQTQWHRQFYKIIESGWKLPTEVLVLARR